MISLNLEVYFSLRYLVLSKKSIWIPSPKKGLNEGNNVTHEM